MRILNLTQHAATQEQLAAGVVDVRPEDRDFLVELLTFDSIPSRHEIDDRAHDLALFASMYDLGDEVYPDAAMIGGAPFFMSALEGALLGYSVKPIYAFSVRESVDAVQTDGTVKKTAVFRHRGFVEV